MANGLEQNSLPLPFLCIIQARMGSTRLPGKVLRPLAGKPVLEHVVTRVRACRLISTVLVATSDKPADDAIQSFADRIGVRCFRGSESDVLDRFAQAAESVELPHIIRITADCPLVDPELLGHMIQCYEGTDFDYYSNCHPVRTFPKGLDIEIFPRRALEIAAREATEPYDREHVTPYFYKHPTKFRLGVLEAEVDRSEERWTLDTEDDYRFISGLYDALYQEGRIFSSAEITQYVKTSSGENS